MRIKDHDVHEFSPGIIGMEDALPSPLPRVVLRGVLLLVLVLLIWGSLGRLDIVAVAEGKLVPVSYLKIVQPAEAGVVREISVSEGEQVSAGQILVRMDTNLSKADSQSIQGELQHKSLELRRIEAQLAGLPFNSAEGDSPELFRHIEAEYAANRRALEDALAQERLSQDKARHDLSATLEIQHKLEQTLPAYRAQEQAYAKLGRDGFAGNLMVLDKERERIEREQDLRAQEFNAESLRTSIAQSEKHQAQMLSDVRQKLQAEKVATYAEHEKLKQEWARQSHRNSLLDLKAPQAGIVKDLATHTPGTVVSPGTVLMTLVPSDEALQAEVWVRNDDAGFVHTHQLVKVKLATFPFQKYGMLDGEVIHVGADSSDTQNLNDSQRQRSTPQVNASSAYRALISLNSQTLNVASEPFSLSPGMQVAAEIKLSEQTVLEYLLSPVRKAFHEAGRER